MTPLLRQLGFATQPILLVPTILRPATPKNLQPIKWTASGTTITPVYPWGVNVAIYNPNPFPMTLHDLDMTAMFSGPHGFPVHFTTAHVVTRDHYIDRSIRVPASSLPAALNVPEELPDFTGYDLRGPGLMKWGMDARKVTGFLGQMTPPPGELVEVDQLHGAASGWGGGSPNAQVDWIMVAVCPWSR
ncbi:hypothetical protein GGF31_004086 [Allomyces arbusculus]|nr:hypothetical protein GGF31_004086 [Allomyces arbusculus]